MEVAQHFREHPQIIVNGFIKAGIAGAVDGHDDSASEEEEQNESDVENDCAFESSDDVNGDIVNLTGED